MNKIFLFIFLILTSNVFSKEISLQSFKVKYMPPGSSVTAIYGTLINPNQESDELLRVEGNLAQTFELHNMKMEQGVMKMRSVNSISIPSKSTLELSAGGLHIMVFDLATPLKKGDKHNIKLFFKKSPPQVIHALVE